MFLISEFRNNLKIELDGDPYIIVSYQAVMPGKGAGFTRTRLKNMITGAVIERTFKSSEKVKKPNLEERTMQYLYDDGTGFVFMDNESYDQVTIPTEVLDEDRYFLKENVNLDVLFFNDRPVGVSFPNFVVLLVTECDPGLKGDTASGATKPATLETGLVIQVPLFVNEGEHLRIDTRSREYIERVKV